MRPSTRGGPCRSWIPCRPGVRPTGVHHRWHAPPRLHQSALPALAHLAIPCTPASRRRYAAARCHFREYVGCRLRALAERHWSVLAGYHFCAPASFLQPVPAGCRQGADSQRTRERQWRGRCGMGTPAAPARCLLPLYLLPRCLLPRCLLPLYLLPRCLLRRCENNWSGARCS